ncbi:MAG TPA: ribosome silencing factor [Anaeromyxobacteraceae bacterium]|nr:ribosome silencing factor [Anaeromyxobacteraceae bacterium]
MATKKKAPTKRPFLKKGPAKKPFASKGPAKKGAAKKGPRSGSPKGVFKGGYKKGPAKGVPAGRKAPVRKAAAAKPAGPGPAAERPDPSRPLALSIAKAGLAKKAEEVLLLDVRGLTSYADYFVVMTADSDRQAGAIADHVEEEMKKSGVGKVGVEGYESGRWILVDYGDVVAHVMNREAREFYDLEGLWADAPRMKIAD